MGVIDGHDMKALRSALRDALNADRPVVVHIQTVKGKGWAPAEEGGLEGMETWHAAKPGSIVDRRPAPKKTAKPPLTRSEMIEGRRADPCAARAQAVHGGLRRGPRSRRRARTSGSSGSPQRWRVEPASTSSAPSFPGSTTTSASPSRTRSCSPLGLALQGAKPVVAIYSTFLQRGFDEVDDHRDRHVRDHHVEQDRLHHREIMGVDGFDQQTANAVQPEEPSTTTVPASMPATIRPHIVTIGPSELRRTCRTTVLLWGDRSCGPPRRGRGSAARPSSAGSPG